MIHTRQIALSLFYCTLLWKLVDLGRPRTIAEEWREKYATIFDASQDILEPTEIARHLMFLYSRVDQLGEQQSVLGYAIENVRYFFNIVTDTNTSHCNQNHMKKVREQLERIRSPVDSNLKAVLMLVHTNLLELCGVLHRDVIKTLEATVSRDDRNDLLSFLMSYYDYASGRVSRETLKTWVFRRIDVRRKFVAGNIIDAWNMTACARLESALGANQQSFLEFARLYACMGLTSVKSCQSAIAEWALFLYSCDQLNEMRPELAKDIEPKKRTFLGIFRRS